MSATLSQRAQLYPRGTTLQNLIMNPFENPWTRYLHIRAEVVDALSDAGWPDQEIAEALSMPPANAAEGLKRGVPEPLHGKYVRARVSATEWLENYHPTNYEVEMILSLEGPGHVRKLLDRDRRLDRTTASQVVAL